MGTLQKIAFKTDNDDFEYLDSVSNVAALPEDERELYEDALKYALDRNDQMEYAIEQSLEQGLEQGLELGRKEGHEIGLALGGAEGRAEGHAEGRADGLAEGHAEAAKETARKLMQADFDDEFISGITGISKIDLQKIRNALT